MFGFCTVCIQDKLIECGWLAHAESYFPVLNPELRQGQCVPFLQPVLLSETTLVDRASFRAL
jgi:hypothetical protein